MNRLYPYLCLLSVSTCASIAYSETFPDKAPFQASFHSTIIEDGHDLIFPSIIRATDYFDAPLSQFYLYTSPHAGADVRLYLSDSVTGPWKLHGTVVDDKLAKAVHVSSPHAVWNKEANALFLYVHAPNQIGTIEFPINKPHIY